MASKRPAARLSSPSAEFLSADIKDSPGIAWGVFLFYSIPNSLAYATTPWILGAFSRRGQAMKFWLGTWKGGSMPKASAGR